MIGTVLITGPEIAPEAAGRLGDHAIGWLTTPVEVTADELRRLASQHRIDGLIVRFGTIDRAVIEASDRLRVIANHGVGYDNIEVAAATRRAIPVFVTLGANTNAVAEHTIALILALTKQLRCFDTETRAGRWKPDGVVSHELAGRRLGVIGWGAVGQAVGRMASALGLAVSAYDPYAAVGTFPSGVGRAARLADLLAASDIVSVHAPLTEATRGLLDAPTLAHMKPGAMLVNTARGAIVDDEALVAALRSGRLAGAALDCFDPEPPPPDHPLLALPNILLTPHIAGLTAESFARTSLISVEHIIEVLIHGRIPAGTLVNPEILSGEPTRSA